MTNVDHPRLIYQVSSEFEEMMQSVEEERRLVTIQDVGSLSVVLLSEDDAKMTTFCRET